MFRVPDDTVLRRLAATTLLIAATGGLAACGGDGDGSGDVASDDAPATTTAGPTESMDEIRERARANLAKVSDTKEGPAVVAAASGARASKAELKAQLEQARRALEADGYDPQVDPSPSTGNAYGAFTVDNTTVVFYESPKAAARFGDEFSLVLGANLGYGHMARTANRIYVLQVAAKVEPSDREAFRKIYREIDAAL